MILADQLMYTGYHYATKSGISIGVNDMIIPDDKAHVPANFLGQTHTAEALSVNVRQWRIVAEQNLVLKVNCWPKGDVRCRVSADNPTTLQG